MHTFCYNSATSDYTQMATIVNLVLMARTTDWLYEHVVLDPTHAAHEDLRWLSVILKSNLRPNVMTVLNRLCNLGCSEHWGISDISSTVADGRIYWHVMLRSCSPGIVDDLRRLRTTRSPR